jgi:hypothetical protein
MKADYLDAKMQSHRGNLQRSARLLGTQLTELERDYLHKRIEEGAEVARLELEQAAKAAQAKKPLPSPVRGRCAACRLFESRTERPSLRLVLCRVWQVPKSLKSTRAPACCDLGKMIKFSSATSAIASGRNVITPMGC